MTGGLFLRGIHFSLRTGTQELQIIIRSSPGTKLQLAFLARCLPLTAYSISYCCAHDFGIHCVQVNNWLRMSIECLLFVESCAFFICRLSTTHILRMCTGWPKNWHTFLYALTSSNIDRFPNLFHCNNTVTKDLTTPQMCRYTTFWNISVLIATTENETTSVTTYFKSVSYSSHADTLNIWCKNCRMRQLP